MRKSILPMYVFAFFIIYSSPLFAQWTQTNGPVGGRVIALTTLNGKVFAATQKGVYRSDDTARTWKKTGSEIRNEQISILEARDSIVYAVSTYWLYWSSDYGEHWQKYGDSALFIFSLSITPHALVMATYKGSLRSTDNGKTFQRLDTVVQVTNSQQHIFPKFFAIEDTVIASTDSGIYRSTNAGSSWEFISSFPKFITIFKRLESSNKIFAVSQLSTQSPLSQSLDNGKTWMQLDTIPFQLNDFCVINDSSFAATALVGAWPAVGVLNISKSFGHSWYKAKGGYNSSSRSLLSVGNRLVFTSPSSGIYVMDLGVDSFYLSNKGMSNATVGAIIVGDTLVAIGGEGFVSYSYDNGDHWDSYSNNATNERARQLFQFGGYLFASTYDSIFRSSDMGRSWSPSYKGVASASIWSISFLDSVMFLTLRDSSENFLISLDSGRTWFIDPNKTLPYLLIGSIGDALYSISEKALSFSTDFGAHWDTIAMPPEIRKSSFGYGLTGNKKFLFIYALDSGIFRSSNRGLSWSKCDYGLLLPFVQIQQVSCFDSILFAVTSNGVYFSTNYGDSWKEHNVSEISPSQTGILGFNKKYLFASISDAGIWREPRSQLGVKKTPNVISKEEPLQSIYPNPLEVVTNIHFSLSQPEFVTLKIYNILGVEINTLLSKNLTAGCSYDIPWKAESLPRGSYFSRLTIGTLSETRHMILK